MAGVRIRAVDSALANKLVRIEHHARRTAAGPKVYSLRLDDTGAVTVSPLVWARLQEAMGAMAACPRFYAVETIRRPPTQTVGGGGQAADAVSFTLDAMRQVAQGELIVPRITLK